MSRARALFIFGTRPEAIKLCPVILRFRALPEQFETRVCLTGQHRELVAEVLSIFGVQADHDLRLMIPGQSLSHSTARMMQALEPVLEQERPDIVLVQGDTASTFCGALAAYYQQIPSGHVEAGLRTGDPYRPFPEEMNRVLVGRLAALHFAATDGAAANLASEGVVSGVHVTGNSGIDALLHVRKGLWDGKLQPPRQWSELNPAKKLILVTAHRRESFGAGIESVCRAILRLARRQDVQFLMPVHPNPEVRARVALMLSDQQNIVLTDPLDYVSFVALMDRSYLLLTDSGGIQEEAPSLGKPVLVMRETTERPEAVQAGTARLTGTDEETIVGETELLLMDGSEYEHRRLIHNPYGDGRAGERIADLVLGWLRDRRRA